MYSVVQKEISNSSVRQHKRVKHAQNHGIKCEKVDKIRRDQTGGQVNGGSLCVH